MHIHDQHVHSSYSRDSQADIYKYAQKKGMFPILPAGQIMKIDENGNGSFRFFLEVLNYNEEEDSVITIPAGTYSCVQVELDASMDFQKIINDSWKDGTAKTIILNNVMLEKYSFENHPSELQKVEMDDFIW